MSERKRTHHGGRDRFHTLVGYSIPHEKNRGETNQPEKLDPQTNSESSQSTPTDESPLGPEPYTHDENPEDGPIDKPYDDTIDDEPARFIFERTAGVEITVVQEPYAAEALRERWRALEIWTRNHIYALDSDFICFDVIERSGGRSCPDNALIGAQLTGGQRRVEGNIELVHPFPLPGTDAVFRHLAQRHGRFGQTSRVERVLLRMRVTNMSLTAGEANWDKIKPENKAKDP